MGLMAFALDLSVLRMGLGDSSFSIPYKDDENEGFAKLQAKERTAEHPVPIERDREWYPIPTGYIVHTKGPKQALISVVWSLSICYICTWTSGAASAMFHLYHREPV